MAESAQQEEGVTSPRGTKGKQKIVTEEEDEKFKERMRKHVKQWIFRRTNRTDER